VTENDSNGVLFGWNNPELPSQTKTPEGQSMIRVTFIEHDGTEHVVEATPGLSLMHAATSVAVPGIDADCGGGCACGTCHVYVDEAWLPRLAAQSEAEKQMIAMNEETRESSRLACQIPLDEDLNGLVARIPEFQM
jgi:2Fe-2S ferredoxin